MDKLFPTKTKSNPQIYAYQDLYNPHLKGLLKVGNTTIDPLIRVQQQYNITKPGGAPYRIVFTESAMRQDGSPMWQVKENLTSSTLIPSFGQREYSGQLNVDEHKSAEEKVDDLLRFLPVLCYQDGAMKQLNAGEVLDMATSNSDE